MDYDNSKFKIWTWKNPIVLHWIINPGLAFNELILGQRVPKIMLVERDSTKNLYEKTKIPCPHCGTLHPGQKWSTENNAFKNWFGLYCDNCGKIIPCLMNLTSCLFLGLTFPFWFWFKDKWKKKWLKNQPDRYKNLDLSTVPNPFSGHGWVRMGLSWGFIMYILIIVVPPFFEGDGLTIQKALIGIPFWAIGGLIFGFGMKVIIGKNKPKAASK